MPASVSINRAELQRVFGDLATRWAADMGRKVVNEAKTRAPVDTGRLRSSIAYTVHVEPTAVRLRVGSQMPYARYVDEGTGIFGPTGQRIYPVRRRAMKFPTPQSSGAFRGRNRRRSQRNRGVVFAKSVAGMPPRPYLTAALEAVFGAAVRPANP